LDEDEDEDRPSWSPVRRLHLVLAGMLFETLSVSRGAVVSRNLSEEIFLAPRAKAKA